MKRTPLYEEHVGAGARMVEFAGWEMPVQYDSIVSEHRTVRESAGVFDASHMGEFVVEGPQAEAFCAAVFANDARRLRPGRAQYSLISNEHGGVVDDVIVYRLAADRFFVCVNAANAKKDFAWLRGRAVPGAALTDVSDEYALLAVQGPGAIAVVENVIGALDGLARFGVVEREFEGRRLLVARTGYTGEDGCELFAAAPVAAPLWRALVAGGARPAVLGARDTLRLEAALPLYGHELGEDITPFEAGLGWVVKLDRPQMVGFEALQAARADVRRTLVGLTSEGGIARQGCAVLAGDRRIGAVTSGSMGPTVKRPVALALVEGRPQEGDTLSVEIRGRERPARVTPLPFYVRQSAT